MNKRLDFRKILILGGVFWAIGYHFVGKIESPIQLYLLYGILCGSANGMIFNTIVNAVLLFFKEHVDTITGFLLLLLGISNMLLGPMITWGIAQIGWRNVFLWISVCFSVFCIAGALICPAGEKGLKEHIPPKVREDAQGYVLKNKVFWILFSWSLLFGLIGQGYIGQAAACGRDVGATPLQATLLVGLFSACNGIGRITLGRFYDAYRKVTGMRLLCLSFFCGCIALFFGSNTRRLLLMYMGSGFLGLGYGGLMITRPTAMRVFFGRRNFSLNLSLINFSGLPASIAGTFLFTTAKNVFGGYERIHYKCNG